MPTTFVEKRVNASGLGESAGSVANAENDGHDRQKANWKTSALWQSTTRHSQISRRRNVPKHASVPTAKIDVSRNTRGRAEPEGGWLVKNEKSF
jgi:hypothetical protein